MLRCDVRVADDDGGSAAAPGFSITMERSGRSFTDVLEQAREKWQALASEMDVEDDG
jgi:hypothetical protein